MRRECEDDWALNSGILRCRTQRSRTNEPSRGRRFKFSNNVTRIERHPHTPSGAASRGRGQEMATGTKEDPWELTTAPGSSQYTMYRDEQSDPPALVCQVGSTTLKYQLRAIDDLHAWLVSQGDWVALGAADEKKPAAEGTVEAWGRSADNPVGGWYGLRNGYRGRFGMYLPPLLEELGLAEVTHEARNNQMRAR